MNAYELTSRPWWLSHAVQTPKGIMVARADAVSTVNRKPTHEDIAAGVAANQYDSGPDCHGAYIQIWVDLTEADLDSLGLQPGVLKFPEVVDGARPRTNRADCPVSEQEMLAVQADLQSEGHAHDHEPRDNTPYQKGDDWDI